MSFSAGYQCLGCSQWAFGPGCSEPSDEKQDNIGDCSPIKHGSKCPSNCTLFWWEDCRTWYPLWIIGKGGSICFIGWHSKAGIWVTLTLLELTVVLNEHVLVYVWGAELDGIAWHLLLFFICLTHTYFCFKFFSFMQRSLIMPFWKQITPRSCQRITVQHSWWLQQTTEKPL